MPRLSRQDFLSYIRSFNTRSYEHQHTFYAPDITMTLPDPAVPILRGPEAISKHYAQVHRVAEETVVSMVVVTEYDHVFFEMEVYFKYVVDTDKDVHGTTVQEGDVFKVTVWALYVIDEAGKMRSIRCNLWEEKMLGQFEMGPLIEESRSRAQVDLR
ncbi:uncharacterized protein CLAFUR5_04448 [Fulvia fulva]|uniref:SnoaL-like domain-containing protein n=1 Tax=Passalora fulva TaxID=5499 RepID=A0A9Q8P7P7_PASFU|nr:uncharacterized protein CLAFUR5_04448 [Fulvia fulva]KAK4628295.1 hypothetical protein CLAFUR0_04472 [Fulvia fulva]UJO16261.1 hypothetical protein CLAFUR5_04448 [Fulvia fulva]WPV28883.1 hypothetical protein CLAFUW7_04475 [Fulvia fulva]